MGGSLSTLCQPTDKAIRDAEKKQKEARKRAQEALDQIAKRQENDTFDLQREIESRDRCESTTSENFFTPRTFTPSFDSSGSAEQEILFSRKTPPAEKNLNPPVILTSEEGRLMASSSMDNDKNPPVGEEEEEEEQPNSSLLSAIFSQLRIGMDLSKVTLPTFLLEPRSLLEKWTDFFSNPQFMIKAIDEKDPMERFIGVLRWYLSGVHVKPKGAKKPYNPILGEVFFGEFNLDIGKTSYIAEQVSHHPPISAYHLENKEKNFAVHGWCLTRTKFLGNSASSTLEGRTIAHFRDLDEEYVITMPVVYVKGLFVGALGLDIGGKGTIECKKTGLFAEMEFKNKGLFGSGEPNSVAGEVTSLNNKKEVHWKVYGRWDQCVYISPGGKKAKKGETIPGTRQLFDVSKLTKQRIQTIAESTMDAFESRRLWNRVTKALKSKDQEVATEEKSFLEDMQRRAAADRKEKELDWQPKYFQTTGKDDPHWTYIHRDATGMPMREGAKLPAEHPKASKPFIPDDMNKLNAEQEKVYGPRPAPADDAVAEVTEAVENATVS